MKKNLIQLVQEVLNYTKDVNTLITLTEPEDKQLKFIFNVDDIDSKLEYVLQSTYDMKFVYEFEMLLDMSGEDNRESSRYDLKTYTKKGLSDDEYLKVIQDLLSNLFTRDAYDFIKRKYKLSSVKYSGLNEWMVKSFSNFADLVKSCSLYSIISHKYEFDRTKTLLFKKKMYENDLSFVELMEPVADLIKTKYNTGKVIILEHKEWNKKSDTWYIEQDTSIEQVSSNEIDHTPVEIVTPHLPINQSISLFTDFVKLMQENYDAKTNSSIGFHVNLIFKKPIDFVKLIIMTNDVPILTHLDRTEDFTTYCDSQYLILKEHIKKVANSLGKYSYKNIIKLAYEPVTKKTMLEYFPIKLNNSNYRLANEQKNFDIDRLSKNSSYEMYTILRFANWKLNPNYIYLRDIDEQFIGTNDIVHKNDLTKIKDDIDIEVYKKELNKIFNNFKTDFMQKFRSINFLKYSNAKMIEFRILGNDYFNKYYEYTLEEIKWFIFMMVVASNDELYKDDYNEMIKEMNK